MCPSLSSCPHPLPALLISPSPSLGFVNWGASVCQITLCQTFPCPCVTSRRSRSWTCLETVSRLCPWKQAPCTSKKHHDLWAAALNNNSADNDHDRLPGIFPGAESILRDLYYRWVGDAAISADEIPLCIKWTTGCVTSVLTVQFFFLQVIKMQSHAAAVLAIQTI